MKQRESQRGMTTVELAIGFLTAALVAAALAAAVALGLAQGACQSASTEVARQLARGDTAAAASATESLPNAAEITVSRLSTGVEAEVRLQTTVLGVVSVTLSGQSFARYEPGVSP
ncbi:MAG: TadE family type IV pilus minor pilin [Arachnia sp.]